MFARVVEFSPTSDAAAQFVEIVQAKALPIVTAQPGCITAFVQAPEAPGHIVQGVSVWISKAHAEQFSRECYPDIEDMLRPLLAHPPKLRTFEVRQVQNVVVRHGAFRRRSR